jgi:hypothetical protein
MPFVVVLLIATLFLIAGFVVGHFLTKQRLEIEFVLREREQAKRIAKAMEKVYAMERKYEELAVKIKVLQASDDIPIDKLNQLFQEIRDKLSSE